MRATTAYFVGAGTIVAAIAIGLGGGIVAGNIMNPIPPKQAADSGKLDRSAETPAQIAPASWGTSSDGIAHLAGSQAMVETLDRPAQTAAAAPAPQVAAPAAKPNEAVSANAEPARPASPSEAASVPENAYAKANDLDAKRAASERRRAEQRRRWAERRQREMREARAPRDRTDWDDVARNVREDSEPRAFGSRPPGGFPQVRLFGSDDD